MNPDEPLKINFLEQSSSIETANQFPVQGETEKVEDNNDRQKLRKELGNLRLQLEIRTRRNAELEKANRKLTDENAQLARKQKAILAELEKFEAQAQLFERLLQDIKDSEKK